MILILGEEQPQQKVPFYPTAIPDRKPIVIRTTTMTTTTTTTKTTTTTTTTTTTPFTTTTFKSRRRTVSPRSYPKYKRKFERKKENIQSLKQKVQSNSKEEKKYSYENVPRYHHTNQVVAVRYPSDEDSKFPHFPVIEEQLSLDLGKVNNNNKKVNIRPVRQRPASFRDSQSQPSFDNFYTTRPTTTTTTTSTIRTTKSRTGNNGET